MATDADAVDPDLAFIRLEQFMLEDKLIEVCLYLLSNLTDKIC